MTRRIKKAQLPAPQEDRTPVLRYAERVLDEPGLAGPMVRAACKRHLRDLETGAARGIYWDNEAAERALAFFPDVLTLTEGDFADTPFELIDAQEFVVGSLFGWKKANGYRRFRQAYIEMGKGSGKSPLAAGIGLYGLFADGERGAEVYCAAVTRDQAGIMFRDAENMVTQNAKLRERLHITTGNIAYEAGRSFLRPVSHQARSLDGKRVHFALLDELHEHRTAEVAEKMRAGTKGRKQPLILAITNSGYDRNSICWTQHDYSAKVVEGVIEDDGWFAYVCALDDEDWPKDGGFPDKSTWIKANPGLGTTIHLDYLQDQVKEAQHMPSKANLVMRLNFCRWTEASERWLDHEAWALNGERSVGYDALRQQPCFGGLDLSATTDLTSLVLVFPDTDPEDVDQDTTFQALAWFWLPEADLLEKENRDGVPYTAWRDAGYLTVTPGKSINKAFVAAKLGELSGDFDIQAIAYDRWRIDDLQLQLDQQGIDLPLVPWGQGFRDMAPAIDAIEGAIKRGGFWHGNNPLLTMCAANAVVVQDPAENRKFNKAEVTGRIDGIVAASMAMGLANRKAVEEPYSSVYSSRGVEVFG